MADPSSISAGGGSPWLRRLRSASPDDVVPSVLPFVLLVGLVVWLGFLVPASLEAGQLVLTLDQSMVLILLAAGQVFVLLTAGIDLSVAGVLAVSNAICATTMQSGTSAVVVSVLIVGLGWLPGAINGLIIVVSGIKSIIVTLATWFIWSGVALVILPVAGGQVPASFGRLATGSFLHVANTVWFALLVAALLIWSARTGLVLRLRAVGSNPQGAFQSGVSVRWNIILAYSLASWFAALAGLFLSAQSLSGDPTVGNSFLLPAIAAAVIGGTRLTGGVGAPFSALVGALVLGYVTQVTISTGLPPNWSLVFAGFVLVIGVSAPTCVRFVTRWLAMRRA
jgi:ribose transport system permease protein